MSASGISSPLLYGCCSMFCVCALLTIRLTEGEFAELVTRVGSSDHEAMLDYLTSEPMSSDGESASGYSSSGSSSSFPESDISSMSEDSSESDGSISDVSTDSCPR